MDDAGWNSPYSRQCDWGLQHTASCISGYWAETRIVIEFAKKGVSLLFLMYEICYALEDKTDAHKISIQMNKDCE